MMLSEKPQADDIKQALEVIRAGGIILYPTDTIWGIGCDATNPEAVKKVYALKGRDQAKSLIILLENENQLASYLQEIPETAYSLIEYAERPLTIVFDQAKNLPDNLINPDGSIAIRIVKHPFCSALLQRFRKPIVSTSANVSGQPSPQFFQDISPEVLQGVDYIVKYGQTDQNSNKPSQIIRLGIGGLFEFIRK